MCPSPLWRYELGCKQPKQPRCLVSRSEIWSCRTKRWLWSFSTVLVMSSLQSIQWQINIDKQQERASIHWQISASRDSRGQCRKTLTLMTLFSYIDPDSFIVKFRPCSAESVRLPTAKTALNQPPMPSLRRGQHLKDACISTPWSIEVAGNPRGPKNNPSVEHGFVCWYIMDILWIYYGFGGYIEIGHNEPQWTFGEGSSSSVDLPRNRCTTGLIPLTHWISPCPCRRRNVDP